MYMNLYAFSSFFNEIIDFLNKKYILDMKTYMFKDLNPKKGAF
jgi:hypothetical protein